METSPSKLSSQRSQASARAIENHLSTGGLQKLISEHPTNNHNISGQNLFVQVIAVKVMQTENNAASSGK